MAKVVGSGGKGDDVARNNKKMDEVSRSVVLLKGESQLGLLREVEKADHRIRQVGGMLFADDIIGESGGLQKL